MKHLLILLLFFSIVVQSNSQEVVSAGGDYFFNSTLSVSWTLGEPISETFSNSTRILTQGFHQSKLSVIGIYDISEDDMQITLFPNPTENFINLKVSNYDDLSFQLFSFDGKLVKTNKLLSEKTEINMADLSASIYFLKVLNKNNLIRSYQIIKQ